MLDLTQITIIGPGLLGASLGLGLRGAGYTNPIYGVARSQATIDGAVEVGAINAGYKSFEEVPKAEGKTLVVVAVPLGRFGEVFAQLSEYQRQDFYITDVGSTKLSVAADAKQNLKQPQFFVPSHPMAGSEKSGPAAAEADLFQGRPCVLCPDQDTDEEALAVVMHLWQILGSVIHIMPAAEHDKQVASISHLPHLLAALLADTADDIGPLDLASTGFRDTSRLALSNPPMRRDIIVANRQPIAEVLDRFATRLDELRGIIREGKDDALLDTLINAQRIRETWDERRNQSDA